MCQPVHKPIDALVIYRRGAPHPLLRAFRWDNRRYDVAETHSVQRERGQEGISLSYLVRCGTDRFAVRLDTTRSRWTLEAIDPS
jgi:hypothetical protein